MVCGTFGLDGKDTSYPRFEDVEPVEGTLYPDDYVGNAVRYGITTGITATTFAPYRDISRAQVVTMVVRAFGTRVPTD